MNVWDRRHTTELSHPSQDRLEHKVRKRLSFFKGLLITQDEGVIKEYKYSTDVHLSISA